MQWLRPVGWKHGQRRVLLRFWQASLPARPWETQCDRRCTWSPEPHGRRESLRGPKRPRRTPGWRKEELQKEGQGPIGSQPEKGPTESGMSQDGSNTTPGHAPVLETQLRIQRRLSQASRAAKRRTSILYKSRGHPHSWHPRGSGQNHQSMPDAGSSLRKSAAVLG